MAAQADSTTQLPFGTESVPWLAVDPATQHVFVSGGPGNSSIVVLDFSGAVVGTIGGEPGASQMALDTATHTLYVALHDADAIAAINTQTLTETSRFSTSPYTEPSSLVIAGGRLWFTCMIGADGCVASAGLDGSNLAEANIPLSIPTAVNVTALASGGTNDHLLALTYIDQPYPICTFAVFDASSSPPSQVSSFSPQGSCFAVADLTFGPAGSALFITPAPLWESIQSFATSDFSPGLVYPPGTAPGNNIPAVSVATTADGAYVAGAVGGSIQVWPLADTTTVRTWQTGAPGNPAHGIAFSPDSSRLFAVVTDTSSGHLDFKVLSKPTVPLVRTTTSLTASRSAVAYGKQASLIVRITGTTTGTVDLSTKANGTTTVVASKAIDSSGAVSFTVTPSQITTYSATLEAGSGYLASTSSDVTVGVARSIAIAVHAKRTNVQQLLLHGEKVLFRVIVNPPTSNETFSVEVWWRINRSKRWREVAKAPFPMRSGGVLIGFKTKLPGYYRTRVVVGKDENYILSSSPWRTFRAPTVLR
jgi:hypothetical protein